MRVSGTPELGGATESALEVATGRRFPAHADIRKPAFSEEQLRGVAHEHWGVKAASTRCFPSYDDQNVCLQTEQGVRFVLKVHHANERLATIQLQHTIMRSLQLAVSAPLPQPCTSPPSTSCAVLATDDPCVLILMHQEHYFFADLLSFVPGRMLAELPSLPAELCFRLGACMGHIRMALSEVQEACAHRGKWQPGDALDKQAFDWDLDNCEKPLERHLQGVNQERKRIVEHFREQHRREVQPRLAALDKCIIHGDANDYNMLLDGDRIGVIDFGDVHYATAINDLAVAVGYWMQHGSVRDDPVHVLVHAVRGYNSVVPLSVTEARLVFPLACMRICVSVIMCAHAHKLDPDNDYLAANQKPGWRLLELFETMSLDAVSRRVTDALGLECN